MMDRSPRPMHEAIRRALEEVRLYSNYNAAIRILTTALEASEKDDDNCTHEQSSSRQSSLDRSGALTKCHSDVNYGDVATASGQSGNTSDPMTGLKSLPQSVSDAAGARKGARPSRAINRTQRFRLLLLRADAYSALRQHERALEDAKAAVLISRERSPEAYFVMGKELLRLFRLRSSVDAFDKAESLLASAPMFGEATCVEEITDEDFWAQRGYRMKDVESLNLNRRSVEQEELAAYILQVGRYSGSADSSISISRSALMSSTLDEGSNFFQSQMTHWKQLAEEARALHRMKTSHVVPIGFLQTACGFLDHQMSAVRCGVVTCLENTTSQAFRLVGCTSPDGMYRDGGQFPDVIPPGYCGIALLQPRKRWSGFVCSVCYELADNSVRCFFCFESPFMGSNKCGVRFSSERRYPEMGNSVKDFNNNNNNINNNTIDGASSSSTPTRESFTFKIPNPSLWFPRQIAPLPSGRKLKVSASACSGSRVIMFSVTGMLSVRLQSVELLTALEFAGPLVLKKMSAVSRHYRELINNLPPPMFFGASACSYPDYCLRSDRTSSPWIVYDKEPVKWQCLFDGRLLSGGNYLVADATDSSNIILYFVGDRNGSLEANVFYGDRRTLIAQIKSSWVPLSKTLYFSSSSGRTFASCYLNRNSELALAWGDAGSRSRSEDVEYIMRRMEPTRRAGPNGRMHTVPGLSTVNDFHSTDISDSIFSASSGALLSTSSAAFRGNRGSAAETYAVWRSQRTSGGSVVSSAPRQTNNGMELVAGVTIHYPSTHMGGKGTPIADIALCTGADALLVTLMTYCRTQWGE